MLNRFSEPGLNQVDQALELEVQVGASDEKKTCDLFEEGALSSHHHIIKRPNPDNTVKSIPKFVNPVGLNVIFDRSFSKEPCKGSNDGKQEKLMLNEQSSRPALQANKKVIANQGVNVIFDEACSMKKEPIEQDDIPPAVSFHAQSNSQAEKRIGTGQGLDIIFDEPRSQPSRNLTGSQGLKITFDDYMSVDPVKSSSIQSQGCIFWH